MRSLHPVLYLLTLTVSLSKASLVVNNYDAIASSWNSVGNLNLTAFDSKAERYSNQDSACSFSTGLCSRTNLKGDAFARPCCVSWGPGRLDCFIRSPSATVLHKIVKNVDCTDCSHWEDLGGAVLGDIECFSTTSQHIHLVVKGYIARIYAKSYFPDGWTDWTQIESTESPEPPSCTVTSETSATCFVRTSRNVVAGLFLTDSDGAHWTTGQARGLGPTLSPLGCASPGNDLLVCLLSHFDNMPMGYEYVRGPEGNVSILGLQISQFKPSAVSVSGRVDVFTLDDANSVTWVTWNNGWELRTRDLGGQFVAAPECVRSSQDDIHCFVVGDGLDLFKNSFNGNNWSGWIRISGPFFPEAPSCLMSSASILSCYARDSHNEIIELEFAV